MLSSRIAFDQIIGLVDPQASGDSLVREHSGQMDICEMSISYRSKRPDSDIRYWVHLFRGRRQYPIDK